MTPLITLCHDAGKSSYAGKLQAIVLRAMLKERGIEDPEITERLDGIFESFEEIDRAIDTYYSVAKAKKASLTAS